MLFLLQALPYDTTMRLRPSYIDHDGFRMPKGFPVAGFVSGLTYQPRAADILISTYPKCGTTWMQHIVWLILNHGEPLAATVKMTDVIPHLEEVGSGFVERLPGPRVIKTHLTHALCPSHPEMKVIYVTRNPFDCAVSFYHHTRGFPQHYAFEEGTFEDYFECFVAGEVDFGDYFENVGSWLDHVDEPNYLFLTYEQMKADPRAAVQAVGAFLGPELGAAVDDAAALERILDHSSFASMRKDQLRWSSKRPDDMPSFVRKGVVGDWANHFSPEQTGRLLARLDDSPHAARLRALWPEIIEGAASFAGAG